VTERADADPRPGAQHAPLLAASGVALLHTLLRIPLIWGAGFGGAAEADERRFHLPVIQRFAADWPDVDLSDYHAASTPGHHLALAWLERVADPSVEMLRFVSGVPVTLMIALVVWWCARRVGVLVALALTLPLACSAHVWGFAALALPESSAWLGVTLLLMLPLRKRWDWRWALVAGVVLLATVSVRQITLWVAAPIWVAGWLGGGPLTHPDTRVLPEQWWPVPHLGGRIRGAVIAIACTLPAFAVLALFFRLWGGLVPPVFQSSEAAADVEGAVANEGLSPAAPAFLFALVGLAGLFYAPLLVRRLLAHRRLTLRWSLIIGGLALASALVVPTSYDVGAGRWSGIWNGVRLIPAPMDRSPVMIALAAFGGVMTALLLVIAPPARARWVLLGALVSAMAAHATGAQLFQRYIEPLVLIMLPMAVSAALAKGDERPARWTLVGPIALAGLLLLLTIPRIGG
jgi:hypothetical protein